MKLNETSGACDNVHLNTFVIDPATARRFECVKEMVRKQGFNNITEPEIIDAILSEITAADAVTASPAFFHLFILHSPFYTESYVSFTIILTIL